VARTVDEALQEATLVSDEQVYQIIRLPAVAITAAAGVLAEIGEPFGALIADKDEVTLIIPADTLNRFTRRLLDYQPSATPYRLITFEAVLEPTMIGFMARVSGALADAGIPIFPYAAYTTDHILVPVDKFDAALDALNRLRSL
jgi:uncharacterized protein